MMRSTILITAAWLCYCVATGQALREVKVPRIIPPSPDAASLGKYADLPVSLYNGTPQVSIRLAEIKVRDISLPFNVNYHAGGIRTEEEASQVGLGWSLPIMATITRTIRGNDDFLSDNGVRGLVHSDVIPSQITTGNVHYLEDVCTGRQDAQPDIFYYNILGYTGKFYLVRKGTPSAPITVVFMSNKEKIKINYNESRGEWTVITKDGYRLILGTKEYTKVFQATINDFNPNIDWFVAQVDPLDPRNKQQVTAWYVDKIISPLKEEVSFTYKTKPSASARPYVSRSILGVSETRTDVRGIGGRRSILGKRDKLGGFVNGLVKVTSFGIADIDLSEAPPNPQCGTHLVMSGSMTVVYHTYLESIKAANVELKFFTSDRDDIQPHYEFTGTGGSKNYFSKPQKLDRIELSSKQSSRSFVFEYDYFNNSSINDPYLYKRLKLKSVRETSGTQAKAPWRFTYEGDGANGANFSLPPKNTFARDHWGFYNKNTGNHSAGIAGRPTLIPEVQFNNVQFLEDPVTHELIEIEDGEIQRLPGANRSADPEAAKAGVLVKIVYPTGGHTVFTFESNTYNLPEGEKVERDFFVVSSQKEFEVPEAALVTISSDLKCGTLSCHGSPTDVACKEQQIKDFSAPYFKVVSASDNRVYYVALYGDYYEKLDPAGHNFDNVEATPCGVKRTQHVTLPAGKYLILTFDLYGFKSEGYASFTSRVPAEPTDMIRQGGGLRIAEMRDHDGIDASKDVIKKYLYTWTDDLGRELSTGKIMTIPVYTYYGNVSTASTSGALSVCATFISDSYSNIPLGNSAAGAPVGYDKVTVLHGAGGENGTSVYFYMNEPDILPDLTKEPFLPNTPTNNHAASNGFVLKEEHLTSTGRKVEETVNGYEKINETGSVLSFYTKSFNGCSGAGSSIQFKWHTETSEWWHPVTTYHKKYDSQDPANIRGVATWTDFTYNISHKQMTSKKTVKSSGETIIEKIHYPLDVTDPFLDIMWSELNPNCKYMQSTVLKTEQYTDGELTAATRNTYVYDSQKDLVLMSSTESKLNNGPFEQQFAILKHDEKGNILELQSKNDKVVSYIYGYDLTLPIAEVQNASSDQVYHTSFEDDPAADALLAKTGVKSKPGDYLFTPPPAFTPAAESIFSYWYFEGGAWHYASQPYSGGQVLISGKARVDEVRIYPKNARMSTYTFDPIAGITSANDHNNVVTYFQYDGFGRLKLAKDFAGNIVKKYDYQFKK
ncbi:MAG TPA: hypothetical protein VEB86_03845 [Chryseosolibacter sp.]|nr:hypothetical protein [Chryseosolibacter sp.]